MMMNNKDVYTRAIESLEKTQKALLNEISIADGRARLHAPTFHYVSMAINDIKALQAVDKVATMVAVTEDKPETEVKPSVSKVAAKKATK